MPFHVPPRGVSSEESDWELLSREEPWREKWFPLKISIPLSAVFFLSRTYVFVLRPVLPLAFDPFFFCVPKRRSIEERFMTRGRARRGAAKEMAKEGREAYPCFFAPILQLLSFFMMDINTFSWPLSNSLEMLLRTLCRTQWLRISTSTGTVA